MIYRHMVWCLQCFSVPVLLGRFIKKTNKKCLFLIILICFSAFIGPSLGGFLLEKIGYRKGLIVILITDIIMVIIKTFQIIFHSSIFNRFSLYRCIWRLEESKIQIEMNCSLFYDAIINHKINLSFDLMSAFNFAFLYLFLFLYIFPIKQNLKLNQNI